MTRGIRATVTFSDPTVCPIADLSAAADTTIESVATSVAPADGSGSVTEFTADAPDLHGHGHDVTRVFSHGAHHRYRVPHDGTVGCPCERLGAHGCPVARYTARDGALTLVFHAADYDELQTVVDDLRDRYPEMSVQRFVRSPPRPADSDAVMVERGKLTTRQLEVLETADEMGYFERPRRTNATGIAAELDIHPSTFREHLAAAESKLLEDIL